MNNTIPFHSATHAPQITVDVNILTMLKQAASCLTEAAGKDVYLAAIGPDMELTIIMEEDAPSVLPCFDEDDALISVKGAPLFISYNPAQVLKLAGKRYLTGPVIFYRTNGHSTIVSLTVEDIYRFQTYLESHSTTLMADGQKLTCMDSQIFLGGSEPGTLKDLSELLGKETIDAFNTSDTRGNSPSYGTTFQKMGHELLSRDELAVLDGGKCILQLRGVRPFLSDKYDLTQHPNYKLTSDYDPKNTFDIEKYLNRKEKIQPGDEFLVLDADSLPPA